MSRPHPSEARYRDNLARHLIGLARDIETRTLRELQGECGYAGLRLSFGPPLSLVALASRPLSDLAEQLSISPQAASQLIKVVEREGYVRRRADPKDGRTRLIELTARGRALLRDGARILSEIEADYRSLIGESAFEPFVETLSRLFQSLDLPAGGARDLAQTPSHSIGVLPLLSVHIQRQLMWATAARGHADLKMSHAQVLPLIGADGARVSALARIQGVSRQTISATARDLEAQGYLTRAPVPGDRRGGAFRLTAAGGVLIADSVAALDELDDSLRSVVGARRMRALTSGARALYRALHLEEEVFAQPSAPSNTNEETNLEQLAARLRRELGPRKTRQLASLLASPLARPPAPPTRSRGPKMGPSTSRRTRKRGARTPTEKSP